MCDSLEFRINWLFEHAKACRSLAPLFKVVHSLPLLILDRISGGVLSEGMGALEDHRQSQWDNDPVLYYKDAEVLAVALALNRGEGSALGLIEQVIITREQRIAFLNYVQADYKDDDFLVEVMTTKLPFTFSRQRHALSVHDPAKEKLYLVA